MLCLLFCELCNCIFFSIFPFGSYPWSPVYNRNICCRSFLSDWVHVMPRFLPFLKDVKIFCFLPFCLWLYFLHLDFNPSGIYFCVCCEVGIILYFFPKWITSWSSTIYWIINLLFTDLKYHIYHILNSHIILDLLLGSVLFLDFFVYYCTGTAPLQLL